MIMQSTQGIKSADARKRHECLGDARTSGDDRFK